MSPDEVLAALDPEQRAAARAVTGPVCVLAGAGTGKTRTVTHRIAYGVLAGAYRSDRVLAVTFTTRAAGEMRTRLRTLGVPSVQTRTFHSAALRQLQYFWPKVVGGTPPRVTPVKAPLVAEAASRCRVEAGRETVRDLASEIEWAKVSQVAPEDYAVAAPRAGRRPTPDPATVARVYAAYEEVKRDRGRMDFEDVLLLTVGVLSDREDVCREVRSRYRHLVVDEYQDVNPLQQRLLDLWLGEGDDLCVVGDASQTIYSFAGARPDYLLEFPARYPGATVVRLVRDYRSTPQVVGLANRLLAPARGRGAADRLVLVGQRPDGSEPALVAYDDEPAEAAGVAARAKGLVASGLRAAEVAVLFRTNAQSAAYEQAFTEAGVPYTLRGAERFFERPEVREATLRLRGAARSGGADVDLEADRADGGTGLLEDVRHVLAGMGWSTSAPPGPGAARDRWESLVALVGLAEDLDQARPGATLGDLVTELDARAAAQHAPAVEGVTLASLHAAKGLEWDAVFLVGLTDGMVPITYAETPEQVEEERRLLYVGVTRAREHLELSWASARTPGGRGGRRASRFLDGVRDATPAPSTGRQPTRAGRRSRVARCRVCGRGLTAAVERKLGRCEGCPSTLDEALLDRLREWRLQTARQAGVPAYVVFTDATLTAIAEARPASEHELAGIPGVGAVKLRRYGEAVLGLCSA
ncbi:MAG: ATP-dependent DNA helicase UvrD2 [Actinomycetes bacterium]